MKVHSEHSSSCYCCCGVSSSSIPPPSLSACQRQSSIVICKSFCFCCRTNNRKRRYITRLSVCFAFTRVQSISARCPRCEDTGHSIVRFNMKSCVAALNTRSAHGNLQREEALRREGRGTGRRDGRGRTHAHASLTAMTAIFLVGRRHRFMVSLHG